MYAAVDSREVSLRFVLNISMWFCKFIVIFTLWCLMVKLELSSNAFYQLMQALSLWINLHYPDADLL